MPSPSKTPYLLTDEYVRLGNQTWQITKIRYVRISTKVSYANVPLKEVHKPGLTVSGISFVLAFSWPLWAAFIPFSGCLALLSFLMSISSLMYTLSRYPQQTYQIDFQLKDDSRQKSKQSWTSYEDVQAIMSEIEEKIANK